MMQVRVNVGEKKKKKKNTITGRYLNIKGDKTV